MNGARSRAANERGRVLADQGDLDAALEQYARAVELDPTNAAAWFNAALVHKHRRAWDRAVEAGQRAAAIQPDDLPTWWNLGIAATALGRWDLARRAWRRCNVDVPDGAGPIEPLGLGPVPVRLNPDSDPEVVWSERLDPARARLANIPLPGSGHRWGDIVLHDGVPTGERILDGRPVPVFDVIERLTPSPVPTLECHVTCPTPDDSATLEETFSAHAGAAEDWTRSVRHLCAECSTGSVPSADAGTGEWNPRRHFGLAADPSLTRELLAAWAATQGRAADEPRVVA